MCIFFLYFAFFNVIYWSCVYVLYMDFISDLCCFFFSFRMIRSSILFSLNIETHQIQTNTSLVELMFLKKSGEFHRLSFLILKSPLKWSYLLTFCMQFDASRLNCWFVRWILMKICCFRLENIFHNFILHIYLPLLSFADASKFLSKFVFALFVCCVLEKTFRSK